MKKEYSLTVIIDDIIWLDTVVEKLAWKHGIVPHEVEEVWIFKKESGKVEGEDLYNVLGKTGEGRCLSIFFIKKLGNKALIITARDMNQRERRRYEKK